jgi:putative addiction module component (TIGR02574 family)
MELKTVLAGALKLSIRDRRKLIQKLQESLTDDEDGLSPDQKQVILARDKEYRADPKIALTLEEFMACVKGGR